jgi:hypothetical protein
VDRLGGSDVGEAYVDLRHSPAALGDRHLVPLVRRPEIDQCQPCRGLGGADGVLAATRTALIFIGSWELLIGTGLLFTHPMVLRATLFLLWLQIAGTFQVFFLLPEEAFQRGNPLLPTLEGQYAIKNLVLIAAGLVIGSTVRRLTESKRLR